MGIKWYFPIYFGLLILIVMACLAMPSVLSYNIQHDNAINQNPQFEGEVGYDNQWKNNDSGNGYCIRRTYRSRCTCIIYR